MHTYKGSRANNQTPLVAPVMVRAFLLPAALPYTVRVSIGDRHSWKLGVGSQSETVTNTGSDEEEAIC